MTSSVHLKPPGGPHCLTGWPAAGCPRAQPGSTPHVGHNGTALTAPEAHSAFPARDAHYGW